MKKQKIIPIAALIIVMSFLAIYKFHSPKKIDDDVDKNISVPEVAQTVQAAQPERPEPKEKPKKQGYKIKEYKGNIAVFEAGETKPFRITEIEVKNLPEADQKELKNGIKAKDYNQLQELLEDYLS